MRQPASPLSPPALTVADVPLVEYRFHDGVLVPAGWLGRVRRQAGRLGGLRLLIPIVLLVLWQLSAKAGWLSEFVLPSPWSIIQAYQELWHTGELQAALPVSLGRAGLGLLIGGGLGLVLGVIAGLSTLAERLYDAPLQMLRTIPFIALVPLFVVWFGIGEWSKVLLIIGASIFPVYLNAYHGIRAIDKRLLELGVSFDMNQRQVVRLIVLPLAMPSILVGWRYAAGAALLGLVAAEQINSNAGIGYILNNANQFQRTDIIIAGILIYAVLGVIVDIVMRLIERALLSWRPRHEPS
ncbi:ABC transporter permease [Pseudomonas sp. MWU16-30317]|uniref:ABC transporter permease n=1 Tax=Pseudomonas sp. MWU16-30317 TaxID=2878095 RepID=UPI001CF97B19|nr:ABC transporter permease [Pseudomonas sp. MWU16-30317]